MKDEKYIVFKRDEFEKWAEVDAAYGFPAPIPDAVVIRRQDVFAPPALDAYANAILCVVTALEGVKRGAEIRNEKPDRPIDYTPGEMAERLQGIADYFHQQATMAWESERKLPD